MTRLSAHACFLSVLLTGLAVPVRAQTSFAHNKIEFANFYATAREDYFPNYRTATGNVAGDGLFKVFPRTLLERGEAHQLSGFAVGASFDDGYAAGGGQFPRFLDWPDLKLYRTQIATLFGRTYEIPDFAGGQVGATYVLPVFNLPADDAWVAEFAFDPTNTNANMRQLLSIPVQVAGTTSGIAAMLVPVPGQKQSDRREWAVCFPSDAEQHRAPGPDAYSGSFNAASSTLTMYGQPGAPSNTGELMVTLRFHNATLQCFSDSSGGFVGDPSHFETHLGPGAYSTDLATRAAPGFIGLFVQAEQRQATGAPTHFAFPFVVGLGNSPNFSNVPVGGTTLRMDPAGVNLLSFWLSLGAMGPIARYTSAGVAGWDVDQLGAFPSARFPWPAGAGNGATLWTQAVLVDLTTFGVTDATNVVRLDIR